MREPTVILKSAIATTTIIMSSMVLKPVQGATLYINTNALSSIWQKIMKSSIETTVTESLTGVEVNIRPENNTNPSNQRRSDNVQDNNSSANNRQNSPSLASRIQSFSFPLAEGINHESEIIYGLNSQFPWMRYPLRRRLSGRNDSITDIVSPSLGRRYITDIVSNSPEGSNSISNGENSSSNRSTGESFSDQQNFPSNNARRQSDSAQQDSLSRDNSHRRRLADMLTQGVSFLQDEESPLINPFSEENDWAESLGDYGLNALELDPENETFLSMASLNDPDFVPIPEANSLMGLLFLGGGLFFGKKIERASD
ncbi:hypothetical protein Cyast_1675 [Cyanobacterium stanieri PCC 7202]|uniref:Uncharacterized protein n=1 Tax=Cyanobacterium stanieri (strain ATCC 29140 / PCC 7202) TaxID=292563 RepID=K9YMK0_CYASC|nr:hypothetical protein Cyast_1675 [Cyanobacterium stanieri PCC 7202]